MNAMKALKVMRSFCKREKKLQVLLVAPMLLAGCTFSNPFVKHEYIEIPTPVSCITWQPTREPSHFDLLKGDEPLWVQIRDLLVDRENDQRFIEGQGAVISGCED